MQEMYELLSSAHHPDCTDASLEMLWNGDYFLPEVANGFTLLTHAASQGHIGIVDCLVMWKPMDVDVMDSRGINALYAACMENRADVASVLLRAGAEACSVSTDAQWTPLMVAAHMGHEAVLDLFLHPDRPAGDVRAVSPKTGETALICAAMAGRAACVQRLLQRCAWQDVWHQTRQGLCAMDVAVKLGHVLVVDLLLAAEMYEGYAMRAKVLTEALSFAVAYNQVAIGERLWKAGACWTQRLRCGLTPLYKAILGGNVDMIRLCVDKAIFVAPYTISLTKYAMVLNGVPTVCVYPLLEKGTISDPYELLRLAVQHQDSASVKFLLFHAPIHLRMCDDGDHFDRTLLGTAARVGNRDIMTMLLGFGLNPNRSAAITPLYIAAADGRLGVVKLLIAYGADVNSQCHPLKHTPLFVACRNEHWAVARILLDAGANPMLPASDPVYAHAYDVVVKSERCGASDEFVSYIHTMFQEQEDRVALLLKARLFVDAQHTSHTALAMGTGRTRGQKRQKWTTRLPGCIRSRFKKNARLPSIKVHINEDQSSQVAELIIHGAFNDHLFQELISLFP